MKTTLDNGGRARFRSLYSHDPLESLMNIPRWQLVALVVTLALSVGLVEFLIGVELDLHILYVPIIGLSCWLLGLRWALALSALCASLWLVDDLVLPYLPGPTHLQFWQSLVRFGFFASFAWMTSQLRAAFRRERELARHDYLTGLHNRIAFYELAEHEIARAYRSRKPLTAAYLDCDHFKRVNDQRGHDAGDRLLRLIAKSMREACRSTDLMARLGGDEFVILFPETDADAAQVAVAKLLAHLRRAVGLDGWPVDFSVGVAVFDQPPSSVDQLLRASDNLMYSVKREGKGNARCERISSSIESHVAAS